MAKQQMKMEQVLRSSSQSIIWNYISSADGMSRWLADKVQGDDNQLTFVWGDLWRHHEIRKANVLKKIKNSYIRLRWDDEEDSNAYVELRMEKNELTNDYVLLITDYANEEDIDSLRDLWEDNLERLHRNTGI